MASINKFNLETLYGLTQKAITVSQQNMIGAAEPNYRRKEVEQTKTGSADHIVAEVKMHLDEILQKDLSSSISTAGYTLIHANQFRDRIEGTLSRPEDPESLEVVLNKALNTLQKLEVNPADDILKKSAMQALNQAATALSTKASSLNQLRFELDQRIAEDIKLANQSIRKIDELRKDFLFTNNPEKRLSIKDDLSKEFSTLSEYLPIKEYTDRHGLPSAMIATRQSDIQLFDLEAHYTLEYQGMASAQLIAEGKHFQPVLLQKRMIRGSNFPPTELASGGASESVVNHLKAGSISGKVDLIHQEITYILKNLDLIAHKLKAQMNLAHNQGTSYPAATQLTATRTLRLDDTIEASGKVLIALVDEMGKPLMHQGKSDVFIPALTLDFDKLDTGDGAGKYKLQDLIVEINRYFDDELSKDKRIEIGGLHDIKLAAISENITAGQPFEMDLEIANFSLNDSTIKIIGARAYDQNKVTLPATFNPDTYLSKKGEKARTGTAGPSLSIISPAGPYPYRAEIDVEVDDGTGPVKRTLVYSIKDPASYKTGAHRIKNQKFSIDSLIGTPNKKIRVVAPALDKAALSVSLVDINGKKIDKNTAQYGLLSFKSNNSAWRFVIDESDSKLKSQLGNDLAANDLGFNNFFGLNDLFVSANKDWNKWHGLAGAASDIKVRDDLQNDYRLFASGRLQKFAAPQAPFSSMKLYTTSIGDGSNIHNIFQLANLPLEFEDPHNGAKWNGNIIDYSQKLVLSTVEKTRVLIEDAGSQVQKVQRVQNQINNTEGVSKENEILKIMEATKVMQYAVAATQQHYKVIENIINMFSRV